MLNAEEIAAIADIITDDLFTSGAGQRASRLVQEMVDGSKAGGWGDNAVRTRIITHLSNEAARLFRRAIGDELSLDPLAFAELAPQ